jgi:nucleoside-diphosphate-sugar epimerase
MAAYAGDVTGVAMNVGSGTNVSIQEIADMISSRQTHHPRRAGDAEVTLADISRIQQLLGWQPRMPFAEGLKQLIDAQATAGL